MCCVCTYTCAGCVHPLGICAQTRYWLDLGAQSSPLPYQLAGCTSPMHCGGSAPHTALQRECLRLSGINYEPEVIKHSG